MFFITPLDGAKTFPVVDLAFGSEQRHSERAVVCISGANEAYERLEEVVGALRTVHDGVLMVAGRLGEREE